MREGEKERLVKQQKLDENGVDKHLELSATASLTELQDLSRSYIS